MLDFVVVERLHEGALLFLLVSGLVRSAECFLDVPVDSPQSRPESTLRRPCSKLPLRRRMLQVLEQVRTQHI